MNWIRVGVIALLAAWSGTVNAELVYQGTREIGISGIADFDTEDEALVQLDLTWGEYIRNYWMLGTVGGFSVSESLTRFRAGVFTEVNFEIGATVLPFIAVSANLLAADVDLDDVGGPSGNDAAFGLGGEIGLKGFLTDYVALSGSLETMWATDNVFLESDGAADTDFRVKFGLRFYY